MALIEKRRCVSCDVQYEVVIVRGEAVCMEADDNRSGCPRCAGAEFDRNVFFDAPLPIELNGYPYFDRGLGMRIESAKHRRQVCKERGLVPLDGTFDMERDHAENEAKRAETRRRYKALNDMYDNHPDFADHRRLRDKGYYTDRVKQGR